LIADDERSIRLTLEAGLTLNGFRVTCVRTGREVINLTQKEEFDAVICDIFMPDGDGLEVARNLRESNPQTPLILMTAQGSVELAVKAVAEGATDFIAKPFEIAALASLVRRSISARKEANANNEKESESLAQEFSRSGLVGRSSAMVAVYKLIARAARTDATVLVTGESGTGKELVAKAVHDFSSRSNNTFVAVNCSGLTDTLLESELFGHAKGSFTGANADRTGLFEAADGGTLFLDELASTSPAFQASLLRVLQSGEVRRVGRAQTRKVNVRVIGASNQPLRELAQQEKFRPDLYYRLSVLTIDLPPLRDRKSDIEILAKHFLRQIGKETNKNFNLSQESIEALKCYDFPGNVRELENALTRAAALCVNGLITLDCLPSYITDAKKNAVANTERNIIEDRPTLEELERRYLELVLNEREGNRRAAAETLGINRRTIQRMLAKYKIADVSDDEDENDED